MRSQSADTPPEVEDVVLEGYRRMSSVEKLRRVWELNRMARAMAAARIRTQYGPSISDRELCLRLAALRLDRGIMIEVFGWDPEQKGY